MSITRRQFLLSTAGASVGAIIPGYYFRALEFSEQFDEPLLEPPTRPTRELHTFHNCDELELCFGDPTVGPPDMTYREFFARYQPEGIETFEEEWGMGPEYLDTLMDWETVLDTWSLHDSPQALAHSYLSSLDLGPRLSGNGAVGKLEFFEDSNMVSCWRGVRYEDDVTLSLLQQRLNDLGTGIQIVTDGYAV
jgi:hypothetical protein